jgi:hypothetical protein
MFAAPAREPSAVPARGPIVITLVLLAGIIASGGNRPAPVDAVLWTALLVLVGYEAIRTVGAAIGRPLDVRADLRLQALALLILLPVAVWSGGTAASAGQWIAAGTVAAVFVLAGALLLVIGRRLGRA